MYKLILILLLSAAAYGDAVNKSPVDLLREGRMMEAQRILEKSEAPERYHLLLDALREPNAIEACFLYREISARFPGTDCDVFAQERLLQAAEMGIDISALVLEADPLLETDELEDETVVYEVERPHNSDLTVKELAKLQQQQRQHLTDEPVIEKTAETKITITAPVEPAKPKREPLITTPIEAEPLVEENPKVEEKSQVPASESTTLDYGTVLPAKKDTGVIAASNPGAASLVKEPEKIPIEVQEKNLKPNPEPTRPHDIDTISPDGWYIQVGAFGNHDNAHKLAAKLRSDGHKVFLVPRDNLLQVRVGSFETKAQGREVGDEIKEKFKVPAVLVTVP